MHSSQLISDGIERNPAVREPHMLSEFSSHRAVRLMIGLLMALALGACDRLDRLLGVDAGSRIPAENLEDPLNASLLVNSAIADFDCAFGAYVVLGGLIGDELIDGTQTANRFPYDARRTVDSDLRYSTFGCVDLGVYTPLNTARASADNVLRNLTDVWTDEQVPNRASLTATAAAYAGYNLVLLGEGFCSAVISHVNPDGSIDWGAELSRAEVFTEAENRFTTAIAAATAAGNADILNFARVGRARTRLNLGRPADAADDAELVPFAYERIMTASTVSARRSNRVWAQSSPTSSAVSVDQGYRDLGDPRVPVTGPHGNTALGIPVFRQEKYPLQNSAISIASGREARLIVAEALLEADMLPQAVLVLNEFRSRGDQLPFASADTEEIRAELIDQRRRELFLQGHHLGDVIRYGIDLAPPPGTAYHGDGVYGNQLCLPLPRIEKQNNPRLGGAG